MLLAASRADGLIFLTPLAPPSVASVSEVGTVTARVDWAVWTVQIGLVVSVVMDPILHQQGRVFLRSSLPV